jgi:tetratricopeptide (TPR) repeat protein
MADDPEPPAGFDQTAASLAAALGGGSALGKLPPEAAAVLEKQSRVLDLQLESLAEESALRLRHLRVRYVGDWLRLALQVLGIGAGLAAAGLIIAAVWQAHEAHGLVIEPLQTPASLNAQGINGTVAASMVLDKMNAMVAATDYGSDRAASSIANDWGDNIKVEVPQTGLSIGDMQRLLRLWLGHETRISGEVFSPGSGLVVQLRAGGAAPVSVRGDAIDVEGLVAQAAEKLFAQTQPYRYGVLLQVQGRDEEADQVFSAIAIGAGSSRERAWGYQGWTLTLAGEGADNDALAKAEAGRVLDPAVVSAGAISADLALGRLQDALDRARSIDRRMRSGAAVDLSPSGRVYYSYVPREEAAMLTGAFSEVLQTNGKQAAENINRGILAPQGLYAIANSDAEARMHDVAAARRALSIDASSAEGLAALTNAMKGRHGPTIGQDEVLSDGACLLLNGFNAGLFAPALDADVALDDWPAAAADLASADALLHSFGTSEDVRHTFIQPWMAFADEQLGQRADADALIGATPLDCDLCLRIRGRIAADRGDWEEAEGWFAQAVRQAPDVPFAYLDWGAARLSRGDVAGAVAEFSLAHQKGPRFADPLEGWGEALMKRGDFAGAVAKFEEANEDAPRWGRNHMMWGEALARLGRRNEAKAQWRAAAGMDLSTADRKTISGLFEV